MWYIHTKKYCTVMRNELKLKATIWINLRNIFEQKKKDQIK